MKTRRTCVIWSGSRRGGQDTIPGSAEVKRRRAIVCVTATAAVWLLAVVLPSGQAPESKTPMAEEVFKNVRVLRGIPVDEFMGTMGVFSAALGWSCEDC